jgi:cell division protein WhiA
MAGERFTETLKQELASRPLDSPELAGSELAAIARLAGTLTVVGGAPGSLELHVTTTSGAVARRTFALVQHRFGLRPELAVHAPSGVRRLTTYEVRIAAGAPRIGVELGILDQHRRPTDALPADLVGATGVAFLRGAVLAAASISTPGRAPHLELVTTGPGTARGLAALLGRILGVAVTPTNEARPRVVLKSGERIGELLATLGATGAFLTWDEHRLRRQVRGEATRLANADGANLRRAIEASAEQVAAVERALGTVGWDGLDDELRGVALARLANPEASLSELGQLVEPTIGKSAVHRRLRRIEDLGRAAGPDPADGRASTP